MPQACVGCTGSFLMHPYFSQYDLLGAPHDWLQGASCGS